MLAVPCLRQNLAADEHRHVVGLSHRAAEADDGPDDRVEHTCRDSGNGMHSVLKRAGLKKAEGPPLRLI